MGSGYSDATSAALSRALQAHGLLNPYTHAPYSEAMIFGLSGGVGAGYILWEFQKDGSAPLVLGLSWRWNYPAERLQNGAQRTGLSVQHTQTASPTKAWRSLETSIADNVPHALLVDWLDCPYGWLVSVNALNNDPANELALIQHTGSETTVPVDMLRAAWSKTPSLKHGMFTFPDGKKRTKGGLKTHLIEALHDNVAYNTSGSGSFSIKALKKWHRTLINPAAPKSWHSVFQNGENLMPALINIYRRVCLTGSDGAALRPLYAAFLEESAEALNNPTLATTAKAYRQAGKAWKAFANSAFPASEPAFSEARKVLNARARLHRSGGDIAAKYQKVETTLTKTMQRRPFSAAQQTAHFAAMAEALETLIDAEETAIEMLAETVKTL